MSKSKIIETILLDAHKNGSLEYKVFVEKVYPSDKGNVHHIITKFIDELRTKNLTNAEIIGCTEYIKDFINFI